MSFNKRFREDIIYSRGGYKLLLLVSKRGWRCVIFIISPSLFLLCWFIRHLAHHDVVVDVHLLAYCVADVRIAFVNYLPLNTNGFLIRSPLMNKYIKGKKTMKGIGRLDSIA